ncbi:MAG: imidazoleglycerol-phosphate dehydratase HisB [Bacillota bacterium]
MEHKRTTRETSIHLRINLDGNGESRVEVGGFLGHMLDTLSRHGMFDLELKAEVFLDPDGHHTAEDLGIVLGEAIRRSVGQGQGLSRFGHSVVPMDDALVEVALDLSGRSYCNYDLGPVGDLGVNAFLREFFLGFSRRAEATIHLRRLAGHDAHHVGEAAFKAFGRALSQAVSPDPRLSGRALSTKGVLS